MPWSIKHAREVMEPRIRETQHGVGVTATLTLSLYDNGMITLNDTPVGRQFGDELLPNEARHGETHLMQDITSCVLVLLEQADAHRAASSAEPVT